VLCNLVGLTCKVHSIGVVLGVGYSRKRGAAPVSALDALGHIMAARSRPRQEVDSQVSLNGKPMQHHKRYIK
jgi:hypothetical protein